MEAIVQRKYMDRLAREKEIARLDGLLNGVSAFSGKIRDYSAFSYLLEIEPNVSVELPLRKFFTPRANLTFSGSEHLKGGIRDLEHAIRHYLVRDASYADADSLLSLQKYLSFRVMELVSMILGEDRDVEVLKMVGNFETSASESVFFCIRMKSTVLVLQFNNDINFKRQQLGLAGNK